MGKTNLGKSNLIRVKLVKKIGKLKLVSWNLKLKLEAEIGKLGTG